MPSLHIEETDKGLTLVTEDGQHHRAYLMKEALLLAGISESTYYRWIRAGRVPDVKLRNRSDWRIFTDEDIKSLRQEVNRVKGV